MNSQAGSDIEFNQRWHDAIRASGLGWSKVSDDEFLVANTNGEVWQYNASNDVYAQIPKGNFSQARKGKVWASLPRGTELYRIHMEAAKEWAVRLWKSAVKETEYAYREHEGSDVVHIVHKDGTVWVMSTGTGTVALTDEHQWETYRKGKFWKPLSKYSSTYQKFAAWCKAEYLRAKNVPERVEEAPRPVVTLRTAYARMVQSMSDLHDGDILNDDYGKLLQEVIDATTALQQLI